jgi:hypothetical protein
MKHLISLLLIFSCSLTLCGQDTFHKLIYLGFPMTRFTSILPTDSCFYVTGTFSDSIPPLTTGALLGKIDLQGELVSLKTVKHPDRFYFNDFADLLVNHHGNLFTAGIVNDTAQSVKGILYFYNHEGDTISTFIFRNPLYPNENHVYPKETLQKENGDYVVLNIHWAVNPNSSDDNDLSLLVIDSSLDVLLYKTYGTSAWDEVAESLVLDNDGGYILGAKRTNEAEVFLNYNCRTLIIKTDSTGGQNWQWLSPAGVLQDEAKAMIKTPDGGLVVASGIGQEIGNNPNLHTLVWDGLIFKLDADRNVVWSTPLRGDLPNGSTELTEMVEATDGNGYVASGIVYEKEGVALGHYTSWLVKVSPEGDSLWARRYTYFDGEYVAPEAWDMKATPDGGYVLVGYSSEVFDIVTNPYIPAWIMKVDSFGCLIPGCHLTDALEEPGETAPSLVIYPNPVGDFLNFQLRGVSSAKHAAFRIVNLEGKVLQEIKGVNIPATVTVPATGWPVGACFLQCFENGVVICSEKFVKQ